MIFVYIATFLALLAIVFAGFFARKIKKHKIVDKQIREVFWTIRRGIAVFFNKEYRVLPVIIIGLSVILCIFVHRISALSFLLGIIFCGIAINIGTKIAVFSGSRIVEISRKSIREGLKTVLISGSAISMLIMGVGIFGVSALYWVFGDPLIIFCFALGASLIILFSRVGAGIFAKAANISVVQGDFHNPAVIIGSVGNSIGKVAGMGADLFESYINTVIAAMLIGSFGILTGFKNLVFLPLLLAGIGIVVAILENLFIFIRIKKEKSSIGRILNQGFFGAIILIAISSLAAIKLSTGHFSLFLTFFIGLISAICISLVIKIYTSNSHKPTQRTAISAQIGPAAIILKGFSFGLQSAAVPLLIILIAGLLAYLTNGIYGVAIAALGMFSAINVVLTFCVYEAIADNAVSLAKTSETFEKNGLKAGGFDATCGIANIIKGFVVGSAIVSALILLISYGFMANLIPINMLSFRMIIGLFVGGLIPFFFSSFIISFVGVVAGKINQEVRRQFKKIRGFLEGDIKPDHGRCFAISLRTVFKSIILPIILIVAIPVLFGFFLGKEALGGLLIGSFISGFLLLMSMFNSGATWNGARKYIEAGNLGGSDSETHKAVIISDTIGDYFKNVASPSIGIALNLMAIIALIIAPLL